MRSLFFIVIFLFQSLQANEINKCEILADYPLKIRAAEKRLEEAMQIHAIKVRSKNILDGVLDTDDSIEIARLAEALSEEAQELNNEVITTGIAAGTSFSVGALILATFIHKTAKTHKMNLFENSSFIKRKAFKWGFSALVVFDIISSIWYSYKYISLTNHKKAIAQKIKELESIYKDLSETINELNEEIEHYDISLREKIYKLEESNEYNIYWNPPLFHCEKI